MPRVLLLNDGLQNGGAERQLCLLAAHLPSSWERRIWVMNGGPYVRVLHDAGVPLRVCQRRFRLDVRPALDLSAVLLRWRPDVVHSWDWMSSSVAGPLCRLLGIAFVDGTIRMGMRPPHRAAGQRWGMRWADYIIANSRAGLSAWHVGPAQGRVVYNGFDVTRLSSRVADAGSLDRPFTVVMAARMDPAKDFTTFLDTARRLVCTEGSRWRFLAIGSGHMRAGLMAGVQDLIEKGIMEFPEAGLEIVPFLLAADAGVLMSNPALHAEGCSNAIMEYMACGLPVVCSEGGGNREVVLDGQTGFVVPPGDAAALAARLLTLRRETARAREMGTAGRQRLLTAFSVESMVGETLKVYAEALQRHG